MENYFFNSTHHSNCLKLQWTYVILVYSFNPFSSNDLRCLVHTFSQLHVCVFSNWEGISVSLHFVLDYSLQSVTKGACNISTVAVTYNWTLRPLAEKDINCSASSVLIHLVYNWGMKTDRNGYWNGLHSPRRFYFTKVKVSFILNINSITNTYLNWRWTQNCTLTNVKCLFL